MNNKIDFDISHPLTFIGFDYGTKSVGVAVGQTVTKTAEPLKVIKAVDGTPSWEEIDKIVHEWKPKALVVGVPFNMDDSEQSMTKMARDFADQLKNRFNIPVYEMDERLTTKEARSQLFKEQGYRGLTKGSVDTRSAVIILEDWMSGVTS